MFDGLDDAIGSNRRDSQAMAKITNGLMMRRVDLHIESAATHWQSRLSRKLPKFTARLDPRLVHRILGLAR